MTILFQCRGASSRAETHDAAFCNYRVSSLLPCPSRKGRLTRPFLSLVGWTSSKTSGPRPGSHTCPTLGSSACIIRKAEVVSLHMPALLWGAAACLTLFVPLQLSLHFPAVTMVTGEKASIYYCSFQILFPTFSPALFPLLLLSSPGALSLLPWLDHLAPTLNVSLILFQNATRASPLP